MMRGLVMALWAGVVAMNCCLPGAQAAEQDATANASAAVGQRPVASVASHRRTPLERRVQLLAAELDLDAVQQVKVRALLEGQREQVQRVWSNTATPPAVRVNNTQVIGERTADQIRALLTEEQRKKYNLSHQRESAEVGKVSVETWMNATQAK